MSEAKSPDFFPFATYRGKKATSMRIVAQCILLLIEEEPLTPVTKRGIVVALGEVMKRGR